MKILCCIGKERTEAFLSIAPKATTIALASPKIKLVKPLSGNKRNKQYSSMTKS